MKTYENHQNLLTWTTQYERSARPSRRGCRGIVPSRWISGRPVGGGHRICSWECDGKAYEKPSKVLGMEVESVECNKLCSKVNNATNFYRFRNCWFIVYKIGSSVLHQVRLCCNITDFTGAQRYVIDEESPAAATDLADLQWWFPLISQFLVSDMLLMPLWLCRVFWTRWQRKSHSNLQMLRCKSMTCKCLNAKNMLSET